jgi:ketosteroid isomerase-like protein
MAAIDVMRRYLQTVQRGDWPAAFGFFTDDVVLHAPGRSSLAGERITEVWIFQANQYEVDELPGG